MKQEIELSKQEIISKLFQLESEVANIKDQMKSDSEKELDLETKEWEEAGKEDLLKWEKEHLNDK
jgi:hypothetical protein|tara:strand:+ start:119 stop:313 length:195 start_codon:yes stop_codon:yes gene_type:complete